MKNFTATPKRVLKESEILQLVFKDEAKRMKKDYGKVGWFINMVATMKGEIVVELDESADVYVFRVNEMGLGFPTWKFEDMYKLNALVN